ncbi:MAG: hypothetical protein HY040_12435 [Planctomycetes bacterium]|nr:hypothetical protein [Planctomycetota bacterium]
MARTAFKCGAALLCAIAACAILVHLNMNASAGDKKDKPALSGNWELKGGEMRIEFLDKGVMKLFPHGEQGPIVIVCKCTAEKKLVKAKITELEGKDEVIKRVRELLPVGFEFSFKWQVKDAVATASDVEGAKAPAILKSHLEGEYEKKK